MSTSIIVGGTRGIGRVITDSLMHRGDVVYTASRKDVQNINHINFDISSGNVDSLLTLIDCKINYLVFTHRYRGFDWDEEFDVSVKGIDLVVSALKSQFQDEASVVIIGSNASRLVFDEQPSQYHASRASLEALARYYAVIYGEKKFVSIAFFPVQLSSQKIILFLRKIIMSAKCSNVLLLLAEWVLLKTLPIWSASCVATNLHLSRGNRL